MQKEKIRHIITFVLVVILNTATACGATRSASGGVDLPSTGVESRNILVDNDAVNRLLSTYSSSWKDVQTSVSIDMKSPASVSVSGRLTMVRGVGLNLSIRMLGFEVAAITVSGDSIFAYEKLNKRAVAESIAGVAKQMGVTRDDLCSLFMGQLFMPEGDRDVVYETDGDRILIYQEDEDSEVKFGWFLGIDDTGNAVPQMCVLEKGGREGMMYFSDFVDTPAGPASNKALIAATVGKTQLGGAIEMNYGKAKWNGGYKIEKPSLRGYRLVTLEELMTLFKHL